MNWYESYAFCIWDGGFLPSEAEWEYAAAGGSQQREYPWGSTAPGKKNQYAIYDGYYSHSTADPVPGITEIAPVGMATLGAGLWGQLDMAGEVWEWNLDGYATFYVDPCTDCAYLPTAASDRVQRGAPYDTDEVSLFPTIRWQWLASNRMFLSGFRCARSP